MNPKWLLGVLFLLLSFAPLWLANAKRNGAAQKAEPDYKDNDCVNCHSGLLEPNRAENRASALSKNFQRLFIAKSDAASINLNQPVLL
jgi:hypothetical protein